MAPALAEPGVLQPLKQWLDVRSQTQLAAVNRAAHDELNLPCRDTQGGSALHGPRFRLLRWQYNPDGDCSPEDVLAVAEEWPACFQTLNHPFEGVLDVPGAKRRPTNEAAVAAFAKIRANADSFEIHPDPEVPWPHITDLSMVHNAEPHCLRQLRLEAILCGNREAPPSERPVMRLVRHRHAPPRVGGLVQRLLEWGGSIRYIRISKVTIPSAQELNYLMHYRQGVRLELVQCILPDWGLAGELKLEGRVTPALSMSACDPVAGGVLWPSRVVLWGCHTIPNQAFQAWGATALQLPAGLAVIEWLAFAFSAMRLDFESAVGVTHVGSLAFSSCTGLGAVTLPATLVEVGHSAFCTSSVTTLDLSECAKLAAVGKEAFSGCTGLHMATLGGCSRLRSLRASLFEGCTGLTELKLPPRLIQIDAKAFHGCASLPRVALPRSLQSIGNHAFDGCTRLEAVDLSRCVALATIHEFAFAGCTALASIDLSGCHALGSIAHSAFRGCEALRLVRLPLPLHGLTQSIAALEIPPACIFELGPGPGPVYGRATHWAVALQNLAARRSNRGRGTARERHERAHVPHLLKGTPRPRLGRPRTP